MVFSGCQLDNLVLINKIKEQLMAEKIRQPHLPAASPASQQPLLTSSQADGSQHGSSKAQQMPALYSQSPSQPDIALHARPASSSVTGSSPAWELSECFNLDLSSYLNKKRKSKKIFFFNRSHFGRC